MLTAALVLFALFKMCGPFAGNGGGAFAAAVFGVIAASTPLLKVFQFGQWSVLVLLSIVCMAMCLEKNRDYLAGLCWAVAMIKPHFAVLFIIPLVMSRKWKTIATAVAACVLLSIPPALMCKTSPVDMIIQVFLFGAPIFGGNGFIPWPAFAIISHEIGSPAFPKAVMALGLLFGTVICVFTSLEMKSRPWAQRICAVTVISLAWTYLHISDFVLYALPVAFILACAFGGERAEGEHTASRLRLAAVTSFVVFLNCSTFETPREIFENALGLRSGILLMPLNAARCLLIPASWILVLRTLRKIK